MSVRAESPSNAHVRQAVRMTGHDYSAGGIYFVTVCTVDRRCLFGNVEEGELQLSTLGEVVRSTWNAIPEHNPGVDTDVVVVMPNHVHGILRIAYVGATHASPGSAPGAGTVVPHRPRGPLPRSLGSIVGSFKSASTRLVNQHRSTPGADVWQRGFHEHLVRDDRALERIRQYIAANPANWRTDPENAGRDAARASAADSWCV